MRSLLLLASFVILAALLLVHPREAHSRSGGSSAGFTGGPAQNGQDCTICHFPFDVNSGSGSVTVVSDVSGVVEAGEEITLTVTVNNTTVEGSPRQGFQLSVENAAGQHQGTILIVDADNTRFSESTTTYATHTLAGTTRTSWQIGWRAPQTLGDVTVYVAGNAANDDGTAGGDLIYTATLPLRIVPVSSEPPPRPALALSAPFPNPARVSASVQLTLEQPDTVTAELFDGLGRRVRVISDRLHGSGLINLEVPVQGLAAGVYFVRVRTSEAAATVPLSVVR